MDSREIADQVYALTTADPAGQPLTPMVREALDVRVSIPMVRPKALRSFTLSLVQCSPYNVSLSFNGGKDCT